MERSASQRVVITFDLHGYGNLQINSRKIIGEAVRIGVKMSGGEFPIEVFPIRIQSIISSLHDCQGYSRGLCCCGYPCDHCRGDWQLPSGTGEAQLFGKSHSVHDTEWSGANGPPLSSAFQSFIKHDYCQNQEYQKLYAEYKHTMSISNKERLEVGLDEFPQVPVRRRFLVSDITPKGLSLIHAQNPRGLCL